MSSGTPSDPWCPSAGPAGPQEDRAVARAGIVVVGITLLTLYGIGYVIYTRSNVISENQFAYVTLIEKFHTDSLTFADLWSPFGEHRVLGYKLLFLANAVWLHLNSLLEAALIPISLGAGGLVLFRRYRRDFPRPTRFAELTFIPILLLFGSPNQYADFANGMILGLAIGSTLFALVFILLEAVLEAPTLRNRLQYAGTVFVTVLLFGSAYSTGFSGALILGVGIFALTRWRETKRLPSGALIWSLTPLVAAMALYLIPWAGSPVGNAALGENLAWVFSRPVASAKFLCLMMASTVLSTATFNQAAGSVTPLVLLGSVILFFYAFALTRFFRGRMWNKGWVPFFLILHALMTMLTVLLGRSRLGEGYAFYPQYLLQTKLGTIGVLWVLTEKWSVSTSRTDGLRAMACGATAVFCQAYTADIEWKAAPYRKAIFESGLAASLRDEESLLRLPPGKEVNSLLSTPTETEVGLRIAKKYRLAAYATCPTPGRTLDEALLAEGIYPPEDGVRWMGKTATFLIRTGPQGRLTVEGFVPPSVFDGVYRGELEISVRSGRRDLATHKLGAGSFSIEVEVCSECDTRITLELSKDFVPRTAGLGADERALGVILTKVAAD